MYENRALPPLSRKLFLGRMARHAAVALSVLGISLVGGMAGYVHLEHLGCMDAFLNASMILGGMGPVDLPKTDAGKLFDGLYALYSGLVILGAASIVITPLLHRMMHRFHWKDSP